MTPKQKLFILEYLKDLNATQAAIRAGYSQRTAKSVGCENLTKPYIQEAIQEAQAKRAKRTEITADWVLKRLRMESKDKGPRSTQSARVAALKCLGEHLALFVKRHEHSGSKGGPLEHQVRVQQEDEIRAKAAAFLVEYDAALARAAGVSASLSASDHGGKAVDEARASGPSGSVSSNGSHT